jgi:hypothetical protein
MPICSCGNRYLAGNSKLCPTCRLDRDYVKFRKPAKAVKARRGRRIPDVPMTGYDRRWQDILAAVKERMA